MAYYNGKKVLSVVKTDQAQFPTYEGSYNITENGTLQTAYKALTDNIVVNVPSTGLLEKLAQRMPTGHHYDGYFSALDVYESPMRYLTYNDLLAHDFSDTEEATSMTDTFANCRMLEAVPFFNTSNVTLMSRMFYNCRLIETIPLFDTGKVTDMGRMFYHCDNLKVIPALDVSNCVGMANMLDYCTKLEEIHMIGIKANLKISESTRYTRTALVEVLNNLQVVLDTKQLVIGSTNLAKLTAEDIAIGTNKGWTIS